MVAPDSRSQGWLPTIRRRLFGERDAVDAQLADIAHQGMGMARVAHACAFLLIILFSLGSLVALSGGALVQVATLGAQPKAIPATISAAVSTLLVTAMDVALVYAAGMLRILAARRASGSERQVHVAVLVCGSLLESGTYIYMAAQYDQLASPAAWLLVIARALAAPIFGVYLSMARPLPVGPRDILYQVELATGHGVIADAVKIANDASAPLQRKMALFGASAIMTDEDRARLGRMIAVMESTDTLALDIGALPGPPNVALGHSGARGDAQMPDIPPSTPAPVNHDVLSDGESSALPAKPPSGTGSPTRAKPSASKRPRRGPVRSPAIIHLTPMDTPEQRLRDVLTVEPGISIRQLAKRASVSESTASKYIRLVRLEAQRAAR